MTITIALVGNPNSGKTTLFNQLTGNHQYVGNWPGVTVEKKAGRVRGHEDAELVDLPGIYSLSPYTNEEVVARNFLADESLNGVINIVDATNLERNLFLTEQLMEFGVPVVIALNQMDIVKKRGYFVDAEALSNKLGVPVCMISALQGDGIEECVNLAIKACGESAPNPVIFSSELEKYLDEIAALLPSTTPENLRRFYTVKAFERDKQVLSAFGGLDVEEIVAKAEAEFDDDSEGIITNERYNHITSFIADVYNKQQEGVSISQKIDKVVTNRILALPIFIVIIGLVYYIAISSVGGVATDWMNDGVFGEGWYVDPSPIVGIEGAQAGYDNADGEYLAAQAEIAGYIDAGVESKLPHAQALADSLEAEEDLDEETLTTFKTEAKAANLSYTYVPQDEDTGELLNDEAVIVDAETFDKALTIEEPKHEDYGIWVPGIPVLIEGLLASIGCAEGAIHDLVIDGIVSGVGAVLGFVPQILILFFLLAILEGCGYMSRVAFILDRVFRRFGLSGKTFIPMLIGTGCGVPAIMASRTIESESARRLTVMTTTFMPCSAKLPIIALFAGAIFGGSGLIAVAAYFVGIASIIVSGIILKKTRPFQGKESPFVMELPEYRLPRFIDVLRSMWERGWSFIKKAGTIILASCVLVWFLSNFGVENGAFGMVADMDNSILAVIGNAICIVFTPLGWGDWRPAAATVTGLIAKENIVSTLAVLYGGGSGLWANLALAFAAPAAASLMFFNLLCAPCFASMAAIRREQNSHKWFWASIGYQCLYAYLVALCIYQFGSAAMGNANPFGLAVAVVIVCFALIMLFRPQPHYAPVQDAKIVYTSQAPQISSCNDCAHCAEAAVCSKPEKKSNKKSGSKFFKGGSCH